MLLKGFLLLGGVVVRVPGSGSGDEDCRAGVSDPPAEGMERIAGNGGGEMIGMLQVELPHPPGELRPNGRVHWAAKARAVKNARTSARQMALARMQNLRLERFLPGSYTLVWFYKGIAPDADNCLAACKAYLDGCCDTFGVDDRCLECAGIHRVHDNRHAGSVVLTFVGEAG